MKKRLIWLMNISIVIIALIVILSKFWMYLVNPWTRNGQVNANVIQMFTRVSAPVIKSYIHDGMYVNKDQLLFELDPRTFEAEVKRVKGNLEAAKAEMTEAKSLLSRWQKVYKRDKGAISLQQIITYQNAYDQAQGTVEMLKGELRNAELNLEFTKYYAPSDGYIVNLQVFEGYQAVANKEILTMVDTDSFYIYAFFKENEIANIKKGQHAYIDLMTYPDQPFLGEVETIGWGISQYDGSVGQYLLPNVEPTFEWIRLAQRVPVRIKIVDKPDDIILRVGTTASVVVYTDPGSFWDFFSLNLIDLNPFNY